MAKQPPSNQAREVRAALMLPKDDRLQMRINGPLKDRYLNALKFNSESLTDHLTEFISRYVLETEKEMKKEALHK